MIKESGTRPNFRRSFGSDGPTESSRLLIKEYLAELFQSPSGLRQIDRGYFFNSSRVKVGSKVFNFSARLQSAG